MRRPTAATNAKTSAAPLTPAMLRNRLAALRHVALDLDGTLYRGGQLFPQTLSFLKTLDRLGIGYTFLTNNSSLSRRDYRKKLHALGLPASLEQIQTSTQVALEYLRARHPKLRTLLALGTPSFRAELREAGFHLIDPDQGRWIGGPPGKRKKTARQPEAVLVAFDMELTYDRLCLASAWITRGKPFFATHLDRTCPSDPGTVLVDCGAICACITAATGVEPVALGKPNPAILHSLCRAHHIRPRELAMVGDRLYTDIAMANRAGALSVLVLSGESTRTDARHTPTPPACVFDHVGEFAKALRESRQP